MRIALNAHLLSFSASYRQAGISRLIHATIQGLQAVDGDNEYVVFVGDRRVPADYARGERWQTVISRLPTTNPLLRILWEQAAQPWAVARAGADLVHDLAFVRPLFCPTPAVVTVYDLTFILFPAAFNRLNRRYLSTMTPWSARSARRVIAISESTKRDLVRLARVPAERIDVVYPGLEPSIKRAHEAAVADFRRRHGLPEHFVLFVGTLEPRKNARVLVQAYALLRRRGAIRHALVLAGARGWRYESVFSAIEESGVKEHIILPGYVPHEELPLWYSAADLFVYPSLYEGFGLPVLEAMACGVPVITANVSSLPEVTGDAGILVEPTDVDALASAMDRVLHHAALQAELRERGMARARTFTWERMAQGTLDSYRRAVAG